MLRHLEADFPQHSPRPQGAPKPLEGILVIDFSHFLAGPFATMIMGDMGADVIKIEAPGRGDEFRYYPPVPSETPDRGAPYMWSNRNKRSVALNLKTADGVAAARDLIAQADVVCENFSTGVMERFGLDYESVRSINPRLIYCSVSAYGRAGEFADRLGFDPVVQAESGFISMNGYPDREGVRSQSPVVDIATGMMICNAILGALVARARTGQGQAVEVTLFENAVLMTGYAAMQHLYSGAAQHRLGNTSPDTCPSGVFQTQDKAFYINCGNDKIFRRLAIQVLERPDLAMDPVYSDRNGRVAHREEIFRVLGEIFAQQPWSYWKPRMRAAQIPCGEVRNIADALRSPEAKARNLVTRIVHPELDWIPNVRLPIRYSGTPLADPRPAPAVGEHTDQVLMEFLGYDANRIAAMAGAGAIGIRNDVRRAVPAQVATDEG